MQRIAVALGLLLLLSTPAMAKDKDWSDHTGDVPFVMGFKKAQAQAEFTGKPMLAFFTTTW